MIASRTPYRPSYIILTIIIYIYTLHVHRIDHPLSSRRVPGMHLLKRFDHNRGRRSGANTYLEEEGRRGRRKRTKEEDEGEYHMR
jgi:hypothetical protein